jgi:hypothetical protein
VTSILSPPLTATAAPPIPEAKAWADTAYAGAQMLLEIASLMVFSPSIGRRD